MTSYLLRRLAQALIVVVIVTIIVFVLIHLLPGGVRALLGSRSTPLQVHEFMIANGYNRPLYLQYIRYLANLFHGNLGYSYHYNEQVTVLLEQNVPKTALLVGLAYALAIVVAIPLGLLQAARRNRPVDYALTTVSFIAYSMPIFWLGMLLIIVFGVETHLFPTEAPQGSSVSSILTDPRALVLPIVTLALVTISQFGRFVRSSAIEVLVQDHVRTAKSKGVGHTRILFKHVLRNSLLPVITLIGLSLPYTISGAVITESVFNYPGMGLLFWNSAQAHDYPVMMGCILLVAIATVMGSLIADLLYCVADPRVRYT